ncbi:hypothetical protein [Sulfurovum sp.]|uniref:hypothetical protein n=1 Tax=Sulfurovum sp. TaxID=1969726 RepID=UPI003563D11B
MNKVEIDIFEKLSGQLISVYEEISLLSKKSPNDAVNKFKLKFLNKLISDSNKFLSDKYKPFDDFNIFNEDDIPQNSDVVFILSQYIQCFEKLRSDNVIVMHGNWYWDTDDEIKVRTVRPQKLKG